MAAIPLSYQPTADFFDEQARNRSASKRYALLCYLLVATMCSVMSVLLAPILVSIFGLALDLVNIVVPMPNVLGPVWSAVSAVIDELDNPGAAGKVLNLAALGAIPGLVCLGILWLGLRRLFNRAGVHGLIAALPVRAPNPFDLEEKQLVNVIQEMAIAADLPPPQVMMTDAPGINCGAVGTGLDDAVVIVSRRLLERMDRDQTQGVIGHLIASIGNGDMRIGMLMISVMQMLGVLSLVIHAPISRAARQQLGRLVRLGLGRSAAGEAQTLATMLANPLHAKQSGGPDEGASKWLALITMPATVVDLIFSKVAHLFLLGPALALTWRRRKYLADAAAVQLTRNPDGLARALVHARGETRSLPGAEWAAHMFVFDDRAGARIQESFEAAAAQGPREAITFSLLADRFKSVFGTPAPAGSADALRQAEQRERLARAMAAARSDSADDAGGLARSGTLSFLPSSSKRIDRLRAMGAKVDGVGTGIPGQWKMWLVASPLIAILVVLIGALFVMGIQLVAMLSMFVIAMPVGALHALLRWIGG